LDHARCYCIISYTCHNHSFLLGLVLINPHICTL
jgi:hypothetical protein